MKIALGLLLALAIALGWQFRTAAAPLPAVAVIDTLIGHRSIWVFEGAGFRRHLTTALAHLATVGGLLLLTLAGPGRISLQAKGRA